MESELNKINCIKMGGLAMPQCDPALGRGKGSGLPDERATCSKGLLSINVVSTPSTTISEHTPEYTDWRTLSFGAHDNANRFTKQNTTKHSSTLANNSCSLSLGIF
jgi:hypothetical protein